MSTKFSVTIDAADPYELGKFWELALGYVREAPPPPHETWEETLTAWGLPQERWNDANALVDPDGIGPEDLPAEGARGQDHQEPDPPGCAGLGFRTGEGPSQHASEDG